MKPIDISVVVPVYREEEVVAEFYSKLDQVMGQLGRSYEIIFVDDQSDEATLIALKKIVDVDPYVKVISLSKNFGHQVALTAGIDQAEGKAVIMLDGDLQHPPSLIPELIANWEKGFDIVYTIRKDTKGASFIRKAASGLFYSMMSRITSVDMDINCADFRLMSRKAVDGFKKVRENARFIRGIVGWMGFKKIGIPFVGADRGKGKSKYSLRKLLRFALNGILSFSVMPIRIISFFGLFISVLSFLYILRVIYFVLFTSEALPGWLPILTIILFITGIQMLMLGIVGEYIAEIFTESKHRPLYLVDEVYENKGTN